MAQDFFNSHVIRYLAPKPYWTVNINGKNDQCKKPLDIVNYDKTKQIYGAVDENGLTTLSEVLRIVNAIPMQYAYKLDAIRDGIVVLDIEKTCPDSLKQQLLQLPFIHGDISMSGKGFHLIFPCPALDNVTAVKTVMKEEHGYYEILISHYVSFTNNIIFPQYNMSNAPVQFQQIWDELRKTQSISSKIDIETDFDNIDLSFPEYDMLKNAIVRYFRQRFRKTPADFSGDMSRYEFAVICSIKFCTIRMLDMPIFSKKVSLDQSQQIMLVYKIVEEILEPRPKHEEKRNGMPFLLYQTCNSFATNFKENR